MAAKLVACPACAAPVPYGRLSCPACGGLLASLAGSESADRRSLGRQPEPAEPEAPPPVSRRRTSRRRSAPGAAEAPPTTRSEFSTALPPSRAPLVLLPSTVHVAAPWPASDPDATDETATEPSVEVPAPVAGPRWVATIAPPDPSTRPAAGRTGPAPGPSLLPRPAAGMVDAIERDAPVAIGPEAIDWLPRLLVRPADAAGWVVAIGALLTALAFVLPWASVVIGARGDGGYFGEWGLANLAHLPLFAATLVVLAAAVSGDAVPRWIGSGVAAVATGGTLIGISWVYLGGSIGAGPGVQAAAIGGLLLVVGGALVLRPRRHGWAGPVV